MTSDPLLTAARRAIVKTILNDGVPGRLGRTDGTLTYIDPSGIEHRDMAWARVGGEGQAAEVVVRCLNVQRLHNMPVIVANRDGVPTVIRADTTRALDFTNGRLADIGPHSWTHGLYGGDTIFIRGQQFLPLMARTSVPPDMTVTVEAGFYRYNGDEEVWPGGPSGSLTSYLPSTAGRQHFVIIALDRATNTLQIVDGFDKATTDQLIPFSVEDIATVDVSDAYWPIAAVRLYVGQTIINTVDIFADLRLWGGELYTEAGKTAGIITDAIMVDADGSIMIDADGNVMAGAS